MFFQWQICIIVQHRIIWSRFRHFCVLGRSVSNVILTMPLAGSFVFRWLDLPRSTYVAYQIWNSTFIRLRDKRWSKIYKVSHVTLRTPFQGAIYHSFASTRHDPPTYQIWSMVTNLKSGSCHPAYAPLRDTFPFVGYYSPRSYVPNWKCLSSSVPVMGRMAKFKKVGHVTLPCHGYPPWPTQPTTLSETGNE